MCKDDFDEIKKNKGIKLRKEISNKDFTMAIYPLAKE